MHNPRVGTAMSVPTAMGSPPFALRPLQSHSFLAEKERNRVSVGRISVLDHEVIRKGIYIRSQIDHSWYPHGYHEWSAL